MYTINDLYNNYDKVFDDLDKGIDVVGELVSLVVRNNPSLKFYSRRIPDMPDGKLIAFIKGGDRVIFYVERESGVYAKEIPREDLADYIITPVVFDLDTGQVKNVEDL